MGHRGVARAIGGWLAVLLLSGGGMVAHAQIVQSFDRETPPSVPPGWNGNFGVDWITVTDRSDTPSNAVFASAPSPAVDKVLSMPPILYIGSDTEIQFRHYYELIDFPYDGGVLEASFGGGPWVDIEAAGGTFLQFGYQSIILGGGRAAPSRAGMPGREARSGS